MKARLDIALTTRQVHRRLVCFSALVAFFSFLLGPVLAQVPEHALSREIDFREWKNPRWESIDTGRSILDRYERFRLEAEPHGIFQDKLYGEMPVAAISAVKPVAHVSMNICDRTAAVMNAILSKIPGTNDCAEVTSTQLAAIADTLSLNSNSISSLKTGDFDGLASLTGLLSYENYLSTFPDDIFDEFTSLRVLDLWRNNLDTLPEGVFDELTSLTTLHLSENALDTLPEGIFDELISLARLHLQDNALDTLPESIFDELTSLTWLDLSQNSPVALPEGIFDGQTSLTWLHLNDNALDTLPEGIFDELTSLTRLYLNDNALDTLPQSIFDGLTSLTKLVLDRNALVTLPEGIFDELTSLERLSLSHNDLDTLPEGIFDELTSLTWLYLNDNALDTLPDDIFEDLNELNFGNYGGLRLQGNPGAPFRPVVNASADLTVQPGIEVSIPGSVTGPWGSFVQWTWTQVDGSDSDTPVSEPLPLTGGETAIPSFTAPMTGAELYFRLVATPEDRATLPEARGYTFSDPDWITIHVDVATNVTEAPPVVDFDLLGNYPNPFNPSTTILLDLPETAAVSVDIFNMLGKRIHREKFPSVAAGPSQSLSITFSHLSSGACVYQVTAQMGKEIHHASGRMTLIK